MAVFTVIAFMASFVPAPLPYLLAFLWVDGLALCGRKINGLAFYVLPFSLAWSVYLGFIHLVPFLDIPYSVGDSLMEMV